MARRQLPTPELPPTRAPLHRRPTIEIEIEIEIEKIEIEKL
jgi:hypothetical protein